MDKDLDRSLDRCLRGMLGCGVGYAGASLANIGAIIGPSNPVLGWSLIGAGVLLGLIALGVFISIPFIGSQQQGPSAYVNEQMAKLRESEAQWRHAPC